jgi:hypothetical protein
MRSRKKIAAAAFGAVIVATAFVVMAIRIVSDSAGAEPWFGNSTEEATASVERKLKTEEFDKEYMCDHACRYTKY